MATGIKYKKSVDGSDTWIATDLMTSKKGIIISDPTTFFFLGGPGVVI